MQDTSGGNKYIKGSRRLFHTEDREWCSYYQHGMKGIPLCKNVCQTYMYQRYFAVIHKLPKSLLLLCKRSCRIKRWFPHTQTVCPCPVKQKPSAVSQTPPIVLHLSSYLGPWRLINNFKWNFVLRNLFNLHSFCCTYCISVPYLVIEMTKTVNKLLYGRILFEQAQYDVKAQPVSPLWLYKTFLFLKAQHLAVNCTGYLQDGSRIGWFTLSPEVVHCAGHCNVRRAFFFPQKPRNLRSRGSWLIATE